MTTSSSSPKKLGREASSTLLAEVLSVLTLLVSEYVEDEIETVSC
jgi:hypothetical protein